MQNLSKIVGENLKLARRQKGLTQTQVAERLNMQQQQYSRYETGKFQLSYELIVALCEILETTPNELFSDLIK